MMNDTELFASGNTDQYSIAQQSFLSSHNEDDTPRKKPHPVRSKKHDPPLEKEPVVIQSKIKTLTKKLHSIPKPKKPQYKFETLSAWLQHGINAYFDQNYDQTQDLIQSLVYHLQTHRENANETRSKTQLSKDFYADLDSSFAKILERIQTVFAFRTQLYLGQTKLYIDFLNRMVQQCVQLSQALSCQEEEWMQVLKDWRITLEKEVESATSTLQQKAQFNNALTIAKSAPSTNTSPQLQLLLDEGKTLMDQMKELRQLRLDSVIRGDVSQAQEIEQILSKALSRLHAISGARQFWYASQSNSMPFLQAQEPVSNQLQSVLTQFETEFPDADLVGGQLQSTIDSNIGGLEIFGILKCRQECEQIAREIRLELIQFTQSHFDQLMTEMTLLDNELSMLHSELLAELARRKMDEEIKTQIGEWMLALRAESDFKMAQRDSEFSKLIRMRKGTAPMEKTLEPEDDSNEKTNKKQKSTNKAKPKAKPKPKPKAKPKAKPEPKPKAKAKPKTKPASKSK